MAMFYCVPCGVRSKPEKAVLRVDGDPMCQLHADGEPADAERKPLKDAKGADDLRMASAKLDAELPESVGDVVVVPRYAVPMQRAPKNRAGDLVVRLLQTKSDESVATRCGSKASARTTAKNVRVHAKKLGLVIGCAIKDDIAYLWVQQRNGAK
jgi:hypothetical protein